jgi:hypothetical protein
MDGTVPHRGDGSPDHPLDWKLELEAGTFRVVQTIDNQKDKAFAQLNTLVQFYPKAGKCPKCDNIRLIQIIRSTYPDQAGHPLAARLQKFQNLQTESEDEIQVEDGWIIDFDGRNSRQGDHTSIYYNDHYRGKYSAEGSTDGERTSGKASMFDPPFTNDKRLQETFEAETVAVCADKGAYQVLGSVKWGYTITKDGILNPAEPKASEQASPTFDKARDLFNRFFGNAGD